MYSYSKTLSSGVFRLGDYIEFTLSSGDYSIDEFNENIKAAVSQQQQQQQQQQQNIGMHPKSKTFSWSCQKAMH